MADKIEKEIAQGVADMKKESAAAGYKAERNVERVSEFLKPQGAPFPSDSETAEGAPVPEAAPEKDVTAPEGEIEKAVAQGVKAMEQESAAAGYKAKKNVERVSEFLKPETSSLPSDSDR